MINVGTAVGESGTSVGKALSLLRAFAPTGGPIGVVELARRCGMPKSTAHRLLAVLAEQGVVERWDGRWRLGITMFELGALTGVGPNSRVQQIALPYLHELAAATGHTVHLGVLDQGEVLYLSKIFGHRRIPTPTRVGGRMPAYATGLGKALLAYADPGAVGSILTGRLRPLTPSTVASEKALQAALAQARDSGIAWDRQECIPGLVCAAAPVTDGAGRAVAAISVSGPPGTAGRAHLAGRVRAAATAISDRLRPAEPTGQRRSAGGLASPKSH
ncbi:IclR family transcriptional regulator [Microtetraspora fusca]|uniref:IclR family transcriptional regulator n=1 Tax=Microtetraspora fusca TaxID=1997 RepID=UPI000A05C8E3|nr:IclR family transcriptional regulator [Microtetraspora fusca]